MATQHPQTPVRTRFAPSPTGMLHIGGARTALYNYLYAKHMGGAYLLRIEDTDQARSTQEAVDEILTSLNWLGLMPDEDIIYQSQHKDAHTKVVDTLLAEGKAYKCYCTPQELDQMRATQKEAGQKPMYDGRCLKRTDTSNKPYTIRLKTPKEGYTTWQDAVQGEIKYPNAEIDDFILCRSDGTPTYNLVVVVDDVNMQISHVIRGDDHINNTPKQIMIYNALGLTPPTFAHISLIHGDDGKKLSKRHGAVGTTSFKKEGYLPQAINNYLLQIGWSSEEDILSREEAIQKFDIKNLNKGAANFNTQKLDWLNSQYLMQMDAEALFNATRPFLEGTPLKKSVQERLIRGLPGLAKRAKKLTELATQATIYLKDSPIQPDEKAQEVLDSGAKERLTLLKEELSALPTWSEQILDNCIKEFTQKHGYKMPQIGKPLRAVLLGTLQAPSLGDIMQTLGKEETLARLEVIS